jgi:hypothetical protein
MVWVESYGFNFFPSVSSSFLSLRFTAFEHKFYHEREEENLSSGFSYYLWFPKLTKIMSRKKNMREMKYFISCWSSIRITKMFCFTLAHKAATRKADSESEDDVTACKKLSFFLFVVFKMPKNESVLQLFIFAE